MHEYKLYYPEYALRSYEKSLALKEVEGILPGVGKKPTRNSVKIISKIPISKEKFEKLTFFSKVTGTWDGTRRVVSPHQSLWENSRAKKPGDSKKKGRDIRYLTHSIHEYKGRFYPQLVRSFLNWAGVKKSHKVLDPFCGCGTTLLECALYPVNAIGLDINPISNLIANAKTQSIFLSSSVLSSLGGKYLNQNIYSGWRKENLRQHAQRLDIDFLLRWFPSNNLKKILYLLRITNKHRSREIQGFLHTVISNLVREYSWQNPRDLRTRRRITSPPGNFFEAFQENLGHQIERIRIFQAIASKTNNSRVIAQVGDARNLPLQSSSINTIITSPPYATALPYIDTDRLSLAVMGFSDRAEQKSLEKKMIGTREISLSDRHHIELLFNSPEAGDLPQEVMRLIQKIYDLNKNSSVGFRKKNTPALLFRYFMDMRKSLLEMYRVLKADGHTFLVVGSNRTRAGGLEVNIPTFDFINLIAESCGFYIQKKMRMPPQKSYTPYSKNAIPDEAITLLRK